MMSMSQQPPVTVSSNFRWAQESWGLALRCVPLEAVAPHLFTTRQLELSAPGGEPRLLDAVGGGAVAMLSQVHGSVVAVVPAVDRLPSRATPGDALVTTDPDVVVAVRAADCVPMLIGDRRTGAVAAVHAGWRGTAANIAGAVLTALAREFGSRAADLVVAIGPSIGACCYEVGSDLVDAFAAAGHERYLIDRWFRAPAPPSGLRDRPKLRLDVAGANRDQLVLAGVPENQIHDCGLCTAMHLDLFTSYRAERESAVRIAGAIRPRERTGARP
jgi:YfiH family protein